MSKPEDIPQDVWQSTEQFVPDWCPPWHRADYRAEQARAIMAAKAEERAGCIADAEAERDENASGDGEVYIATRIIGAIRKRGEP